MLELNNQHTLMKRRIDTEVLKSYFAGTLEDSADALPIDIIPKDRESNRCCVYKERAMVRYRIMALLGIDIERDDDEYKSLSAYVREALASDPKPLPTLTTIAPGCSGCPDEQYRITESCRGCFARPCLANCPKDAITFVNGRAKIIEERCIKCGKCLDVCPFHAVIHVPVPCEASCPVGAVHKNEQGFVEIDHETCIDCGHCAQSCPFGAIAERSSLMQVAKLLKENRQVVAMIAPAIEGQFPGTLEQIMAGMRDVGFSDVVEVAEGALVTARHEAQEVKQRIGTKQGFMTTSCCPAYMNLVDKHIPALKDRRSSALSPMAYTARLCRERYPEAFLVFVGPCLAKKIEALDIADIRTVITFSELAALLVARGVDIKEARPMELGNTESYADCREFACSQGVARSVLRRADAPVQVMHIDGIDKKTVRLMKTWEKRSPEADLVEVMCCAGGCLSGPGVLVNPKIAMRLRQGTEVGKVGARPLGEKKRA